MTKAPQPLATLRQRFRRVTTVTLALLLVALTLITVIDVLGRYLFNSPLPGGKELTELLVMSVIFAGLPAICLDDGHITVDILVGKLRGTAAMVQLTIARAFVGFVLGVIAWQLFVQGQRLMASTQTTVYLHVPLGPIALIAAFICAAGAVLSVMMALRRPARG